MEVKIADHCNSDTAVHLYMHMGLHMRLLSVLRWGNPEQIQYCKTVSGTCKETKIKMT